MQESFVEDKFCLIEMQAAKNSRGKSNISDIKNVVAIIFAIIILT